MLLTFAVEAEFWPWRRAHGFRPLGGTRIPVYATHLAGAEVHVVLTGIGTRQADKLRSLLRELAPDLCIATGLAGGLRLEHRSGDVLVARRVRSANKERAISSDTSLVTLAVGCGAKPVECFETSEKVLAGAQEKSLLGSQADAVDMESYFILSEMSALGVPAVAVRAIADPAEQDLPIDFNQAVARDGRIGLGRVCLQLLKAPQRLPALLRFGSQARAAAKKLAGFLDSYLVAVASQKRSQGVLSEVAAG